MTFFTNGLDPKPRSRQVFNFPRPETLAEWVERSRASSAPGSRTCRRSTKRGLWKVQAQAIANLEESFAKADPRALIQMATGSGKTFTAVNVAYRLLKFGGAKRILFLVDRGNLGKQTEDEFANFKPPDDTRKFPTLYTVQRLKTNSINPAAKVVITTIQRLYSMLKGEAEFDAGNEEGSGFDTAKPWKGEPPDVVYNAGIPPEFFDFIIVDECHRSIYELWSQVLLYFDAFLVGLTATPAGKTIGFFNQNLVMQYGHDEAVTDGVNVDFDVYRIRTRDHRTGRHHRRGDTGVYVDKRHKLTRAERLELLNQDLTYTANQLDRDVVSEEPDSHRLAAVPRQGAARRLSRPHGSAQDADLRQGRFPRRRHRAHGARGVRREATNSARRSPTAPASPSVDKDGEERRRHANPRSHRVGEDLEASRPDEILANFRNSFFPRIAVTVDMISTGTDVKPIECVFFLRNVKSAGFFEQALGRPIMSSLHGMFSVGGMAGAAVGGALLARGMAPEMHLALASAVSVAVLLVSMPPCCRTCRITRRTRRRRRRTGGVRRRCGRSAAWR